MNVCLTVFINWSSFVLIEVLWENQRVKSSKREEPPSSAVSDNVWKNYSLDEIETAFCLEVRLFSQCQGYLNCEPRKWTALENHQPRHCLQTVFGTRRHLPEHWDLRKQKCMDNNDLDERLILRHHLGATHALKSSKKYLDLYTDMIQLCLVK